MTRRPRRHFRWLRQDMKQKNPRTKGVGKGGQAGTKRTWEFCMKTLLIVDPLIKRT